MKKWARVAKKTHNNTSVPEEIKERVTLLAEDMIDKKLKPLYIKKRKGKQASDYIDDIYLKWSRSYLYFCAKYKCPSANAISPEFESKFARLEYNENGQFNLAYMRHTETWFELGRDLPLEKCLSTINEGAWFTP